MNKSSNQRYEHTSKAFAPGHISGFFQPIYHQDNVLLTGSRGAGMSVSLGCHSEVYIEKADSQYIEMVINNKTVDDPVIRRCVQLLLSHEPYYVKIHNMFELPVGQGFGMSAAASLAVAYAVSDCLQLPLKKALFAAHQAEVELQTGLGDVIAAWKGGIEIRREPGVLSDSAIQHIPGSPNVILCVVESPIETKQILSNKDKMKQISRLGKNCTDSLIKNPTLEEFFSLSLSFTEQSDLASDELLQAIKEANEFGLSSMCMLGNAVFAMGTVKDLVKVLKKHGRIYQTRVDSLGARLL